MILVKQNFMNRELLKMGIFSRVKNLVSAKANDAIEKLEDPVVLAKEELRKLDGDIARASESYFALLGNKKLLQNQIQTISAHVQKRKGQLSKLDGLAGSEIIRRDIETDIAESEARLSMAHAEYSEVEDSCKTLQIQIEDSKNVRSEAFKRIQSMSTRQLSAKAMSTASNIGIQLNNKSDLGVFAQAEERVGREYATALAKTEYLSNGDASLDDRIEKAIQTANQ